MHARVEDLLAHGHRGAGEGRVGRGLVAGFPGEDVVRVRARAVADFVLVGDVLANDRRVRRHRLLRVDDRRQLLVVDLHQRGAVGRGVAVGGDHHRHFLHLEAHLLVGQHRLHVAAERRHPVQLHRLQVVGGQHRDDAGARPAPCVLSMRLDARVRVGAAHERAEQHARQLDVVDVAALAADEARVFLAQQRGAHALQLGLALQRVRTGRPWRVSGVLKTVARRRQAACAAASFLRRGLHRLDDVLVAGAAAQVAGHASSGSPPRWGSGSPSAAGRRA